MDAWKERGEEKYVERGFPGVAGLRGGWEDVPEGSGGLFVAISIFRRAEERAKALTFSELDRPLIRRLAIASTAFLWCPAWTGGSEPYFGEDVTAGLNLCE